MTVLVLIYSKKLLIHGKLATIN